jgi:hypothetical protein
MTVEQLLRNEVKDSQRWVDTADGVYKRDLTKRIELINWVLENMKNLRVSIREVIENKFQVITNEIKEK